MSKISSFEDAFTLMALLAEIPKPLPSMRFLVLVLAGIIWRNIQTGRV
jgi:hypothetical protein